jgi:predicted HAD superfamily Cof-like phosphohydrolase
MNDMWKDIIKFHEKYGFDTLDRCRQLDDHAHKFRSLFLMEELYEFTIAQTPEDQIDALVDIVVVAMGTAHMQGFDWSKHWKEVMDANMRKVRATDPKQSKRGTSLDIVKPEGWEPPNHTQHL